MAEFTRHRTALPCRAESLGPFDGIEPQHCWNLTGSFPWRQASVTDIPVDERLIKHLDLDIRIVMTWDADLTDMDLWVTEPSGEKAIYSHPLTTIGGKVSRDFTQGYGPEEYLLRRAMPGLYKIETNFFGSTAQELIGAVTLQVDVFTHYGRPDEERQSITLRLKDAKETISVADIRFSPAKEKKRGE